MKIEAILNMLQVSGTQHLQMLTSIIIIIFIFI